jgi:hypothetical protein
MSITYTWSVNQLTVHPTHDGKTDVVATVSWSYRGVDATGVGSSRGGVTDVTYNAKAPFTPFADLTEAEVLGWVQSTITSEQKAEMEAGISGDIDWQKQPSNEPVSPPLPWPTTPITEKEDA